VCHALVLAGLAGLLPLHAQGTAFTYQGRLAAAGTAASGAYDFRFRLAVDPAASAYVGNAFLTNGVAVSNGLFTVAIDFGAGLFAGSNRWLQVDVKTNGAASYTLLTPPQSLAPAPYAIFAYTASNLSGTVSSAQLPISVVTNNAGGLNLAGTFAGNGASVTNVNAVSLNGVSAAGFWKTSGNSGANPTNGTFLGTTDNLPLELKVNSVRALRFEYGSNYYGIAPNVIGGSPSNTVASGLVGAFIGGGGQASAPNRVQGDWAAVLGGSGNTASGTAATAMGSGNTASGDASTAMGIGTFATGVYSTAMGINTRASGDFSTAICADTIASGARSAAIGAGAQAAGPAAIALGNSSKAAGDSSTAMGSSTLAFGTASTAMGSNTVASNLCATAMGNGTQATGVASTAMGLGTRATGSYSTALGRGTTAANDDATAMGYLTTASGWDSLASGSGSKATGNYSTALGRNTTATADDSTALGFGTTANGWDSLALGTYALAGAHYSIAAGYYAQATNQGAFVWADTSSTTPFTSSVNNEFAIRASGGVRLATSYLLVSGAGNEQAYMGGDGAGGDVEIGSRNAAIMNVGFWNTGAGSHMNLYALSLNPTSDRNAKENFIPIDSQAMLEKVASLPLTEWNYKADAGIKHIGPMAQDFYAAFNIGPDDKHIATVDADGVALAAIQGLNQKLKQELARKDAEIEVLKDRLERLERLMSRSSR
jgi:hypothetical protein